MTIIVPGHIRIAERRASPEALAAHGQAAHRKAFGRRLRDFVVPEVGVKAWNGTFRRTLVGE